MFRVIGSHRINHFTLALLYGACVNPLDPKCKLFSLYPVTSAIKFELVDGKFKKCKPRKEHEEKQERHEEKDGEVFIQGHFSKIEFPETLKSFRKEVYNDEVIRTVIGGSRGKWDYPKFEHQYPLTVAYTKGTQSKKLKKRVLGAAVAPVSKKQSQKQRIGKLRDYKVRAASLEGCLLKMIARSGPKHNTAVVMMINDTLEPLGACLSQRVVKAIMKIINYFIMAAVIAGLPKGKAGNFFPNIFAEFHFIIDHNVLAMYYWSSPGNSFDLLSGHGFNQ